MGGPSGKSDYPWDLPRANFSRQPLRTFHCLYQCNTMMYMSDKPAQAELKPLTREITEDSYDEGEMLEEVANVIVKGNVKYTIPLLSAMCP